MSYTFMCSPEPDDPIGLHPTIAEAVKALGEAKFRGENPTEVSLAWRNDLSGNVTLIGGSIQATPNQLVLE